MENKGTLFAIGVLAAIIALIVVIAIINPLVIVGAGQRGVVMNWGAVSDNVLGEGIHWRMPIVQKVKKIDVQTVKMETKILAYSKDIQTVETQLALNYHAKTDVVNKLWQEVGSDYQSRIIDPAIQESVKAATAKFTAQELIEQRGKVKDEIKVELSARLIKYFVLDEFSIIDFAFSDEYEKAVESKQVAQQDALKAQNVLEQVKLEAEQRVAQARGEAEAIKIQAQAITQQGGKDYVQLKAIEKWNGQLPNQFIPGSAIPFVNLGITQ